VQANGHGPLILGGELSTEAVQTKLKKRKLLVVWFLCLRKAKIPGTHGTTISLITLTCLRQFHPLQSTKLGRKTLLDLQKGFKNRNISFEHNF
jgi:hypothetical protein